MSWVLLDDNFNTHPKAVQAGPVACWLFCCGLMYCRKHHTDGFIPKRAVAALGVTVNTKRLEAALVEVRLWEAVDGGYRVHDYHAIYESDAAAKAEKEHRLQQKRHAGRIGGIVSWQKRSRQTNSTEAELQQTTSTVEARVLKPIGSGSGNGSVCVLSVEGDSKGGTPPLDVWLRELIAAYPEQSVSSGHLTEVAFMDVVLSAGTPDVTFTVLMANLANHKRGHQWRVKGMVPRLDRWLREGLWQQTHEEHPASVLVTDRTAGTLAAAASILKGPR